MSEYREEDYLLLSGLQHFKFCRRQWALIHIENQWADNFHTTDGALMHARAHDSSLFEKRGDVITARAVAVFSRSLGVSGQCDVVEFHRSQRGVPLHGQEGLWQPYPVEYKRGKPNEHGSDELQLCAQALCLEEMLACPIPDGALFYGEPRRRKAVEFTGALREEVRALLDEMHRLFARGHTPKVRPTKACRACSLSELCLPTLMGGWTAAEYIRECMEVEP